MPASADGVFSPAEDAVEYIPVKFGPGFEPRASPYQGWPNDEKDRLWEELYEYGLTLGINSSTHDRLLDKSERMPLQGQEDRYIIGLDVFHQLHCLNAIRKAFFPRHYNMSMENQDGTVNFLQWLHVDHCIDSIRQSLMCNADVAAIGYQWINSKIMEPQMATTHMCRNFSKIHDWALSRWVRLPHRRLHVEDGRVVDYSGWGPDPEEQATTRLSTKWNHTVDDL